MTGSTTKNRNVIFWGAGATRALGIKTTPEQGQFIRRIAGVGSQSELLEERVSEALADSNKNQWRAALVDLICILGDGPKAYESIHNVDKNQLDAMRRNLEGGANDEVLKMSIIRLRMTYDWPALKAVVRICPGSGAPDRFKLNDLFNLLDMHIPSGFGFRSPAGEEDNHANGEPDLQFLDARRLIGAKNALVMLLAALLYVDYQVCIASKGEVLQQYKDFATVLGRRVQRMGLQLAREGATLDLREFYQGDVGFVSMNYDPVLLWAQYIANRELNHSGSVPHIGQPPTPLHVFNDFGHLIPSRSIDPRPADFPWYPMNEPVAQRLNELKAGGDPKVRLTKILFPHGSLCWRECPDCGKLSAYHADQWELAAVDLFLPPPLLAFNRNPCPERVKDPVEREQRWKGRIDARSCLHCGTLTFANHTPLVTQSSFKVRPPSFIEEIQRDLGAMTMQADHIILMGYSLPPDDVVYRAFFSARSQRKGSRVRCTVVNKDPDNPGWHLPDEIKSRTFKDDSPVNAARDVFGEKNVRFYGGGIPEVFLDEGVATDARLDRLLAWS